MANNGQLKVRVIGDDEVIGLVTEYLSATRYSVAGHSNGTNGAAPLTKSNVDVILYAADANGSGPSDLETIHDVSPTMPVIAIVPSEEGDVVSDLARAGVHDCLVKSELSGSILRRAITLAIDRQKLANALREVEELATRHSVISNIGRIVGANSEMADVVEQFGHEVQRIVPFDRLSIMLIDEERGVFVERYVVGVQIPGQDPTYPIPIAGSMPEKILTSPDGLLFSAEEMMAESYLRASVEPIVERGLIEFIAVPFRNMGRTIGMLALASRIKDVYSGADLVILKEIADQIAGPVTQAEAVTELKRLVEVQSTLAEMAKAISQTLVLNDAVHASEPFLNTLLPAAHITLNLVDRNHGTFLRRYVVGDEIPGYPASDDESLDGSATAGVLGLNSPIIISNEELHDASLNPGLQAAASHGIQSLMIVPLKVEGRSIGTIAWSDYKPDIFTAKDLDLALTIATQIIGGLANCELHERSVKSAEQQLAMERLSATNRELEVANEVKAQMISNVSHELRTPLTSMLVFADMLYKDREGSLSETYRNMAGMIRRGGRQLDFLIGDLLLMSRIQTGRFKLDFAKFQIGGLVEEICKLIASITETKQQDLTVEIEDPELEVEGDRARIGQILSNILSNASKYSPDGSPISVTVSSNGTEVVIAVQDHGKGIPAGDEEEIFNRFTRLNNDATRSEQGTGLGLHIVKTLVEYHNGRVEVESVEGEGATFKVSLPLSQPAESTADAA